MPCELAEQVAGVILFCPAVYGWRWPNPAVARRSELLGEYERLDFHLGYGWIYGDAYPGNTLWDGKRALLGDWDEVGTGPRELDLVNTHQGARSAGPRL